MAVTQAGRFDQPVRIERPYRARNEFSEDALESWVLVGEVWADAILPSAQALNREIASGARAVTERIVIFRLRWPQDIEDGDRIVWRDEPYGVEGYLVRERAGEVHVTGVFRSGTDGR